MGRAVWRCLCNAEEGQAADHQPKRADEVRGLVPPRAISGSAVIGWTLATPSVPHQSGPVAACWRLARYSPARARGCAQLTAQDLTDVAAPLGVQAYVTAIQGAVP